MVTERKYQNVRDDTQHYYSSSGCVLRIKPFFLRVDFQLDEQATQQASSVRVFY